MNRSIVVFAIFLALVMISCSDTPKVDNSGSKEATATAQLNKAPKESTPEVIDKIEVPQPKKEQSKSAIKEEAPPIQKEEPVKTVHPPTEKKPVSKPKPLVKQAPKTFANISFDKLVHEFGEIDEGDQITHKFKFKNTGNGPLIIDNVDVSCGCTMPSYPIIPIGPGETGEIGVVYSSKGKFGTQKPSITIKTNATQPIVKLYMSGSIKHVFEKAPVDTTDTKG